MTNLVRLVIVALAAASHHHQAALGKFVDEGPPSDIDCSTTTGDFEYYIEKCFDTKTQLWINGQCKDGVKTELSQLHLCARSSGSRPHCHDCNDGNGNIKHVCGSDTPIANEACPRAFSSDGAGDCADEKMTVYSHGCTSESNSFFHRESHYCEKEKVYGKPAEWTCGESWYWDSPDDPNPALNENNRFCLDCGLAIGVCASSRDATCEDLGLPAGPEVPLQQGEGESEEANNGVPLASFYPNSHRSAWVAHGIVGVISFGILVPLAITSVLFRDSMPTYWIYINGCINIITFAMTLFAVGTAFVIMNGMGDAGEGHLKELHHIVGLLLLLLISFQTIRPPQEPLTDDDDAIRRSHAKIMTAQTLWYLVHCVNGLLIFALGSYQVRSGLGLFARRYGATDWGSLFIGYIILVVVAMFGCKLWMNRKEKKKKVIALEMEMCADRVWPESERDSLT